MELQVMEKKLQFFNADNKKTEGEGQKIGI